MSGVIYVDLKSFAPLPNATALRIAAGERDIIYCNEIDQAKAQINSADLLSVLVCNAPVYELFACERVRSKNIQTILVTDMPMPQYSHNLEGREEQLTQHVIANRPGSDLSIHDLRVTLQKIISNDIFGVSKYLTPNTQLQISTIKSSLDRDAHNKMVTEYALSHNLGQNICRSIHGITEELLMNAIYDAPSVSRDIDQEGTDRSVSIELEPSQYSTLKYGFDGTIFAISVSDPFGAFSREKFFQYVKKVLLRRDSESLIDKKKGGAGLGIFKVLYSSHGLICNIKHGEKTEMIALIDTHHNLRDFARMPRSIHYFSEC